MTEVNGFYGMLVFDGTLVVLRKNHKVSSFINQGIQGERFIVARTISAVEFRDAVGKTNGFVSFDFPGKNHPRPGVFDAAADENAIVFTPQEREPFLAICNEIISYLSKINGAPTT